MVAVARREPARDLASEVNRLFDAFFDAPLAARNGGARRWVPAMDLLETEDHYLLRADLPGAAEDDVKIEVENRVLTISGQRAVEHEQEGREGYHLMERAYGSFSRALTLPEGVDPDRISASFDRGVLEVRIPKPEESKPRRVNISVGAKQPAIEGSEAK